MGRLGVQPHKGFIHDDQLRLVQPRGDDGQLLLHAVGIGGDGLGQILRQLEPRRIVPDACLAVIGADAEDIRDEVQVFDAAHKIVQIRVIGDVGQLPLAGQRLRPDGLAVDIDLPRVELQDARHRLQRGGLARAVVSDKAVQLPRLNVQAQVVHRLLLPVGLGQMLDFQHMLHLFSRVLCGFLHIQPDYTPAAFPLSRRCPRMVRSGKSGAPMPGAPPFPYAKGNVTRISVPFPTSLCRWMAPWWYCTACLTMDSPNPVPPEALEWLLSTR